MDAIAKAPRQSFRMRGRSFVALAFCPVVPIAGWLEEIDVTLARSPGFFAGEPVVLDLSAVDLSQSAIAHLIKSRRRRVYPCLRSASRPCDGGFQRQRCSSDFLSKD